MSSTSEEKKTLNLAKSKTQSMKYRQVLHKSGTDKSSHLMNDKILNLLGRNRFLILPNNEFNQSEQIVLFSAESNKLSIKQVRTNPQFFRGNKTRSFTNKQTLHQPGTKPQSVRNKQTLDSSQTKKFFINQVQRKPQSVRDKTHLQSDRNRQTLDSSEIFHYFIFVTQYRGHLQ